MAKHLLENTLLTLCIASILGGCGGGTDEGYDPGFETDAQLVFSEPAISASIVEETGVIAIDLTQGGTVNGAPYTGSVNISDMTFTVDKNYVTPQAPANGDIPNQTISPFTVEDGNLLVNTDAFADNLSTCDTRDIRGDRDENGNAIPDGIPDFPSQVTYEIDFAIDNGFPLEPGTLPPRRTLTLTIDAIFDDVQDVTAAPVRVSIDSEAVLFASVLPEKACNKALTFEMADESIATIDIDGTITPVAIGTTSVTVTSVSNPELSATVDVEVFSEFTLDIANKDFDANGLPTGKKVVPSCVSVGLEVVPAPAAGDALSGNYVYEWTSSNSVDFPLEEAINYGELGTGRFNLGDLSKVGFTFDATVSLASGATASTPIEEVASQSIMVEVAENRLCNPGTSAHNAGFNTDFAMDGAGAPWRLGPPGAASGGAVATVNEALSGSAIEITAGVDEFTSVVQQVFNKQRNWHSSTYGLGAVSIGLQHKPSIWVKLDKVPSNEITLKHTALAWTYVGMPASRNFNTTRPGAVIMESTLKATTEWQYVEFTVEGGTADYWEVPAIWDQSTDVFIFFEVYGLNEGDKIILDEYGVVKTN